MKHDEPVMGYKHVMETNLSVYFMNGHAQTFVYKEGDTYKVFPEGTEGTPAYAQISYKDTGEVVTIYLHHVSYTRVQRVIRKRQAEVPGADTHSPHTTEPPDTSSAR